MTLLVFYPSFTHSKNTKKGGKKQRKSQKDFKITDREAGELFYHDAFDEEAHVRRGVVGVDCYRLAVVAGAATSGIVFYLYATLFARLYGLFGVLGCGAAAARGDL